MRSQGASAGLEKAPKKRKHSVSSDCDTIFICSNATCGKKGFLSLDKNLYCLNCIKTIILKKKDSPKSCLFCNDHSSPPSFGFKKNKPFLCFSCKEQVTHEQHSLTNLGKPHQKKSKTHHKPLKLKYVANTPYTLDKTTRQLRKATRFCLLI
jgi:hypothetical protein